MRSTNTESLSYRVLVDIKRLLLPVFPDFRISWASCFAHSRAAGSFCASGNCSSALFPMTVRGQDGESMCSLVWVYLGVLSQCGASSLSLGQPDLWADVCCDDHLNHGHLCSCFCLPLLHHKHTAWEEVSTQEAFVRIGFTHSFIIVWSLTLLGCHAALWCLPFASWSLWLL